MKKFVIGWLIILAVGIVIGGSCIRNKDTLYDVYQNSTIRELKERGTDFLRKEQADSALFYYTLAAGKYRKNLPDSLKLQSAAASCNAGHVYLVYHHDFASSYACMLDALDIAEECDEKSILPTIYLNLGNIYLNYDYNRMLEYYKKAFYSAIESGDDNVVAITISMLMTYAIADNVISGIEDELKAFDSFNFAGKKEYKGIRNQRKAINELEKGKWRDAIRILQESRDQSELEFVGDRFNTLCDNEIAAILSRNKCYDEAIELVKRTALDTLQPLEMRGQSIGMLADLYYFVNAADSSMKYSKLNREYSDSIYKTQQYGSIRDIRETREVKKLDTRLLIIEGEKSRLRLALVATVIGVVMVVAFAIILLKKNKTLRDRNRELFKRHQEALHAESKERNVGIGFDDEGSLTKINDELQNNLLSRIRDVLDNEEEILSKEFSLTRLAELVDSNTHYVSEIINAAYQKNFNTILGELRVKIACQRLCDTENNGNLTIEAIADSVGFKSRSNFVVVFKKVTGLPPSQYKKIAMEEKVQ